MIRPPYIIKVSLTCRLAQVSSTFLLAAVMLLGSREPGAGQTFPTAGQDTTYSMGVFQITVDPAFYPLVNATGSLAVYPGFDGSDGVLTSPLCTDNNTTIGRSSPNTRPYTFPVGGVHVDAPTFDTISGYGAYPAIPALWASATGVDEVLTEIENFTLISTGSSGTLSNRCPPDPRLPTIPLSWPMVMAGTGAGVSTRSIGMVQQLPSSSPNDFPAQSFFDIFVNVNLPSVPGTESGAPFGSGTVFPATGAVLYNDSPLIITNTSLAGFPPTVIYIHGETPAVPLKFKVNNPPFWSAGDIFGYLVLAGHGTITNDCTDTPAVNALLDATLGPVGSPLPGMPVEWLRTTNVYPSTGSTYSSLTGSNFVGQPIEYITFSQGGGTLYLRSLSLGTFPGPVQPPPTGSPAVYSAANIPGSFQFSTDGQIWYPATGSGPISLGITNVTATGSTTSTYATEMIQLSLTGTISIVPSFLTFTLRQSPTLPSVGGHTIRSDPRGYRISSFFDVFTELSTDGGNTWVPANRSIRVQASAPPAAPNSIYATVSNNNIVMNWLGTFTLQTATNVIGPYIDVGKPTNTFTNTLGLGQKYFRLRQ